MSKPKYMKSKIIFSIIVPVYENWDLIPILLERLRLQTVRSEAFEIILVDNGSVDFFVPNSLPSNAKVLRCHTAGSYAARNFSISHAQGSWFVFTDADCKPKNTWLEILLKEIIKLGDEKALLAGAIQMQTDNTSPTIYEMYDLVKGIPQAWYVSRGYAVTANLAVSASLLRKLGGFDASRFSGGDAEFTRRAVSQGAKLYYVEQAVVEHPTRTTWQALETKARRVKGGQLTSGTKKKRRAWLIRTFTPPVIAFIRFMGARDYPIFYRFSAVIVQVRIWGVEMLEAYRLLIKKKDPERR